MGFLNAFLEFLGFGIGLPFGLLIGFFLFVYSKPKDVKVINHHIYLPIYLSIYLSIYVLKEMFFVWSLFYSDWLCLRCHLKVFLFWLINVEELHFFTLRRFLMFCGCTFLWFPVLECDAVFFSTKWHWMLNYL